ALPEGGRAIRLAERTFGVEYRAGVEATIVGIRVGEGGASFAQAETRQQLACGEPGPAAPAQPRQAEVVGPAVQDELGSQVVLITPEEGLTLKPKVIQQACHQVRDALAIGGARTQIGRASGRERGESM